MKLSEAMILAQQAEQHAEPFRVALVCGYTPVHVKTFLAAHLQLSMPRRRIVIWTGLYGNTVETLESIPFEQMDAIVLSVEWEDLDPRLGFRNSGSWNAGQVEDIVTNVRTSLHRIENALSLMGPGPRIVVVPPTLALPPLFHVPGFQASIPELALQQHIAEFQVRITSGNRVAVVSSQRLAEESPIAARHDVKSDLVLGLPYSLTHADALARLLAKNVVTRCPKKGIITDLDDTLWSGIVGEVGPEGVTWDLSRHAHLHALYQKLLASLSTQGVLIAIASKNDPAVAKQALQRSDLLLSQDLVFPVEVHWNSKSESVSRILKTWNLSAGSVIFVDDSPMELAEVAAAFPQIQTVLFPKNDVREGVQMLRVLRDLCGKGQLSDDDKIRRDSLRRGVQYQHELTSTGVSRESFLEKLNSAVTLHCDCADSYRAYELINKTNQFNLNGIRYTESEWRRMASAEHSLLLSAAYEDKFGPLGVIAVLQGQVHGARVVVNAWVLSCRAFGRRIEHVMLQTLFARSEAEDVEFNFIATEKNGPMQDFLAGITGRKPECHVVLSREHFEQNCPPIYHKVSDSGKHLTNELLSSSNQR